MPKPKLTFFCELDAQSLKDLFDGRVVLDDLRNLDAAVSLGILDFSDDRAAVVKRLNQAGVPVIAWLLLPEEEGYWFNASNYQQAAARYTLFKTWTTRHDLQWAGIGLDIEMDMNEMRALMDKEKAEPQAAKLFKRLFDKTRVRKARGAYQALVELIKADGYPVESYHLPLILEERQARSTILQRTLGLVDMETDRDVLMLYSSFLRPNGDAVLWSYAPQADSVGVGSTGGGVELEGALDAPPLTWEEFSRDLRLCVVRDRPIHIFSLEGCVRQEFLSKLATFDWDKPVTLPDGIQKVHAMRTGITAILWILQRPWVILLSLATLIGLGFLFKWSKER